MANNVLNVIVKMNFEMTPGFKINSTLLYSSDKHLFQKRNEKKSISYYNCYVKECKAKVKVDSKYSTPCCSYEDGASTHIHGVQEHTYQRLAVGNRMKVRCSTEKKRPREIFNEECIENQRATENMQFAKRSRTFRYHLGKGIPRNPKTLQDVEAFFKNKEIIEKIGKTLHTTEPKLFYQDTVVKSNFAYVIFSSESILANLPENRSVRVDCTFKCVPKSPFNQLLILQTDYMNHVSRLCFLVELPYNVRSCFISFSICFSCCSRRGD